MLANRATEFDALKADYDRDGVVIIRKYLSDAEVSELRAKALPLAEQLLSQERDPSKYKNVLKSLARHDDFFAELLKNGRHVPLLEHLLGCQVMGLSAAWFDRPEGQTDGIGPHVDALGRGEYPGRGATIWFALDSVNVNNGCLHYLRGSHKQEYEDVIPIPGIDTESANAIAAELEPGDAVIHSALTVHWSGGNESGKPRRAVSFFYFSADDYAALHPPKKA